MTEGLSPLEAGKAGHEHGLDARKHARHTELITIAEAVILSVVTLVAAWSGYSAAKWSTESGLALSQGSTARAHANREYLTAVTVRAQDSTAFNAWFTAHLLGKQAEEQTAERRFRPAYDVAFRAWLATKPFTNPNAPRAVQYMPQYTVPAMAQAVHLDEQADEHYAEGEHAATTSDQYVRVTVLLASVLFIVGISSHLAVPRVRYGLIAVGGVLLVLSGLELLRLPMPP